MTGNERQGKGVPAAYIARMGWAEAALCAIVRRAEAPETVLRWGVGRDVYSIQAHGLGLNDVLRVASSLHRL
jgi:tetrahydromethanopterin S-methyltransferase subunit C